MAVSLLLDTMLSETCRKRGCLWIRLSISLPDFRCFSLQLNLLFLNPSLLSLAIFSPTFKLFSFSNPPPTFSSTYFKIPFLHRFSPSPVGFFSLLLVRVHFVQQLPHRAVLQFEPRLWGNALGERPVSEREGERKSGISAR